MNHRIVSIGILVLLVSTGAQAEDAWSRFRGPGGSGISDAATIPTQWTDKDYNWKVKLPGVGHSSPVVWGKRIFLTAGNPATGERTVLCLNAADGNTVWRRDFPSNAFAQHSDNSFATATPAADADGVVVTWSTPQEVTLLALDNAGKDVWRRDLGPYVGIHGSGSSPIILGDLVVLANEQEDPGALPSVYSRPDSPKKAGKSFLIAVERASGQTRWQIDHRSSQAPYSTPCVYAGEGGRAELIFSSTSHGLTSVDPATGKVNWEIDTVFQERCVGSPVAGPGLVIAGHGYGSRGVRYVAVRPPTPDKDAKPTVAYEINKPVPLVPTPLVKDGRLFLWNDDGFVACHDTTTGKLIWREKVGGSFYGSPVCVNDRLYCIARNGEVVVLAAADRYELLGRVPLGEPSFATPAVCGGVMYLRTRAQLFSLGGKKP